MKNKKQKPQFKIGIGLEGVNLAIWKILSVQGDTKNPDHYIVEMKKHDKVNNM